MAMLGQTPSQTVGPYFAYGLLPKQYGYDLRSIAGPKLAQADTEGEHIRIEGRVFDGNGEPIPDAMIEIWQADALGRYANQHGANAPFMGSGRCGTGTAPNHCYWFDTIKPGAVDGDQAPHVNVIVFMRGMLVHAFTRLYFSDEDAANSRDPALQSVPADRRSTLIAGRIAAPTGPLYRFDIRMQGPHETVFFDA